MECKNLDDLEINFDHDLVSEFMGHYEAMMEQTDTLVLQIENASYYRQNINEIYRTIHTLKSSSGFFKLEKINRLCTLSEEVLDVARELEGSATDDLIDWLFAVCDELKLWLEDLQSGRNLSLVNPSIIRIPIHFIREEEEKITKKVTKSNKKSRKRPKVA